MNCSYYRIQNEISGEVRIVKVNNYSIIASYEGKNITIKN